MSIEKITEKLDLIEAQTVAEVEKVKSEAIAAVEAAKNELTEKFVNLETKVAQVSAPSIITLSKTVREDVNKSVREQLKKFVKKDRSVEKEIKMFEDEGQYDAYMKESSALTGGGAGVGGRTAYDPVFHKLRLLNPMRGVSRTVATEGATYQFRAKTGNAGATWGYAIQNNGAATTEATNIWQLTLQDLNVQFPIRTAALDDIDGLEANVVDDMLMEFSQVEGQSMISNNDQTDTPNTYGGTNGLRGLNQYAGANATYTGGTITTAAFGTSGTGSSSGLHSIATYDQLTTNGASVGAANVTYADIIEFIHLLPQEYWTPTTKFLVSPLFLAQIRGLKDSNGTPVFERMAPLVYDGIVGQLLGLDVVVNKYVDSPDSSTSTPGTTSLYPMYFGDWQRGHTIVDRLNMVLRRYDQTLPGYITFFGEKRLCTSVVDPFSIIRYRSTATAT
jgi:predicted phage gp36 major capsid-like protein